MNKKEKLIISEVIDILKAIPDIRNNCDMEGLAHLRVEMKEAASAASTVLTNLLWINEEPELEEDIKDRISRFKEFVKSREPIWNKPQE
jgi:hypothetical protein